MSVLCVLPARTAFTSISMRVSFGVQVVPPLPHVRTVANPTGAPLLARNTMSPESAQGCPLAVSLPKLPSGVVFPDPGSIWNIWPASFAATSTSATATVFSGATVRP